MFRWIKLWARDSTLPVVLDYPLQIAVKQFHELCWLHNSFRTGFRPCSGIVGTNVTVTKVVKELLQQAFGYSLSDQLSDWHSASTRISHPGGHSRVWIPGPDQ